MQWVAPSYRHLIWHLAVMSCCQIISLLARQLGTITPDGADVFSYDEVIWWRTLYYQTTLLTGVLISPR